MEASGGEQVCEAQSVIAAGLRADHGLQDAEVQLEALQAETSVSKTIEACIPKQLWKEQVGALWSLRHADELPIHTADFEGCLALGNQATHMYEIRLKAAGTSRFQCQTQQSLDMEEQGRPPIGCM